MPDKVAIPAVMPAAVMPPAMMPSHFPFLSLPTEVRVMVYKIVMQSQEKGNTVLISRYTVRQNRKPWKVGKVQTKWPCLSGQMLRVCRQISHEAITILYGKNVFQTVGFRVLRKLFLDKIGARNLAMLNSLKIDVEVDSSHRTYPYGEWTPDFLAKCERYIGLRSIQNIVMTMSYSATLQYAVRNMDVYFLIRDLGIRPYPAICACVMSSLIHTGLHMTHDFKERSYQTSDGLLLKEVTLTKLAPEQALQRVKAIHKDFGNPEPKCATKRKCRCWRRKAALCWGAGK